MMNRHARSTRLLAMAALAMVAAGCSGGRSGPKEADLASDANVRSTVIVTQVAVDSKGPAFGELDRTQGLMVDGVVTETAGFVSWYGTGQNLPLSQAPLVTIADEQIKAEAALRRISRLQSADDREHHVPALSSDEAARVIIATELLDSGDLTPNDLPGVLDTNHKVKAGAALDAWYAAHASQPVAKGSNVTLATDAERVVAEINKPGP